MGILALTAVAKLAIVVAVFTHLEYTRDVRRGLVRERVPCARIARR